MFHSHHVGPCFLCDLFSGESSPSIITCPFCRHETHVPDEEVSRRLTFDPVVFNDGSDACPLSYSWSPPPRVYVGVADGG